MLCLNMVGCRDEPIRGQYPGHVITLSQSEASEMECLMASLILKH